MGSSDLIGMTMFRRVEQPYFIGVKSIMAMHAKTTSELEVTINMSKQPIPYPKDNLSKIENAYYGLIKFKEFTKLLVDIVDGEKQLKRGIFNDNIRHYLGSHEKIDVNRGMKDQLLGKNNLLFGLLNNGITIICDKISINSEEVNLVNYQIVNGCQTSNVIFECLDEIDDEISIFLPIRLISTEDEDTKNAIIKATNSQNTLKPEQLMALSAIQKAIEQYYASKNKLKNPELFYERRTEQYRDASIQKTKIVTISTQIKATSAFIFDLPHAVSGQYGKVEKETRGLLFNEKDFNFMNIYYVSGLLWYKVDRFVNNSEIGKPYKRARWHIMMLTKYLISQDTEISTIIDKKSEKICERTEIILKNEKLSDELFTNIINIINECLTKKSNDEFLKDRKVFERKDTTSMLIECSKNAKKFTPDIS